MGPFDAERPYAGIYYFGEDVSSRFEEVLRPFAEKLIPESYMKNVIYGCHEVLSPKEDGRKWLAYWKFIPIGDQGWRTM